MSGVTAVLIIQDLSSDTDTKAGILICCCFRSTLAQYSEGVGGVKNMDL